MLFDKSYVLTVTESHINGGRLALGDHWWGIHNCMGPLQSCDIGKRIYVQNGVYSAESKEQRDARIASYEYKPF